MSIIVEPCRYPDMAFLYADKQVCMNCRIFFTISERGDTREKGWTGADCPLFFHRRRRKAAGAGKTVPKAFYREKSPKYGENLTIWPRNIIIYMMNGRLSQEV